MAIKATRINIRGLIIGTALVLPFKLKVNDVYHNFTGATLNAAIWDEETGDTLATASTGGGTIVFSTGTVTNDTVTITFDAAATADILPGTYRFRCYWEESEMVLLAGNLNFVDYSPS